MCGINGFNFENQKLIRDMNKVLKHRGSDNAGDYIGENISLGHNRLSIIDLSSKGNQPMIYSHNNKKIIIVYNGEIYNFKDIKKELKTKGYNFKSQTDSEVILASYLEWGERCVDKFNGMWAFCIYDFDKSQFFMSRDRIGKKPLYYFFDGNKFIFSSEIKGILNHIKPRINKDGMDLYLAMGFIPSPYSIYENIFKIGPGYNLTFNLKNKNLKLKKYFNYPNYRPIYNEKFLIDKGKRLVKDAVDIRLISDVGVGVFLSGGIDSSTIIYELKNKIKKKNINTFSSKLKNSNDMKYIKFIKDNLNLKNYVSIFKNFEYDQYINKILYYFDEPFVDYSMFPTYFLCENASQKVKVCLSGDGGDEIFGGYWNYRMILIINILRKFPKHLRRFLVKILNKTKNKKATMLKEAFKISLLKPEEIYSEGMNIFYKPKIFKDLSKAKMNEMLKISKGNLLEAVINYDKFFRRTGDNYVCRLDRCSMAHTLEVRCPFFDYRLLDFSSRIPTKWKVNLFQNRVLMRKIIKNIVPQKIINREKEGFSPEIENQFNQKYKKDDLKKIVANLFRNDFISKEWKEFFLNKVLIDPDIYGRYIVRIVFLKDWINFWNKKFQTKIKN